MGIGATYKQIPPVGLDYVRKNPGSLGYFLFEDYQGKDQPNPDPYHRNSPSKETIAEISLELVWTEILAVLEKFADVPGEGLPVSSAVILFGANEIEPENFGYDVRFLTNTQVETLATKLNRISEATFWENYDRKTMSGWDFPEGWSEEDIEQNRQNILQRFNDFKAYYQDAASRSNGMIIYLS